MSYESAKLANRLGWGVTATILGLSLSTATGPAEDRPKPGLGPCETSATPTLAREVINPYMLDGKAADLSIHQDSGEAAREYRGPLAPDVVQKIHGAVVKIGEANGSGSGFLVEDRRDERVVITAAHVILANDVETVMVTDADGHQSRVKGGCYIKGSNGITEAANDRMPDQIDIAILRTERQLGSTTLTFAVEAPSRGDCVGFYNFQQDRPVTDPANYTGIALDRRTETRDNTALVGLGVETDPFHYESTLVPGGSGGAVVDCTTGELTGMSVSKDVFPRNKLDRYDVSHTAHYYSSADIAVIAGLVDAASIETTLEIADY